MLVVATEDFELYHDLLAELRGRDATFTTIEPGEDLPEGATVVIVGADDPVPDAAAEGESDGADEGNEGGDVAVVRAESAAPREAVTEALAAGGGARRTIGIDPGSKPGIAVLEGGEVVAAFQVPESRVGEVIRGETDTHPDAVVRIGDGARLRGSRIVDDIDAQIELVDETGTTPHLGTGARGMGDVLAAVNIARREGEVITEREVEPTPGEIQAIKDRAREQSGDRTLPEALARKVAAGDLTIEEALGEHEEG
ncbi:MAG: hypothetical protein ABEH66_04210 [Halobacteriales archaeon]